MDENFTRAFMREVAEESAEKAVKRTLTALGIDHENPLEVQKDLATLREIRNLFEDNEVQQDFVHLRRWRKSMDAVHRKGIMASVGFMVLGGIALLVTGLKDKLPF